MMIGGSRTRAWLTNEPWRDSFDLRIVVDHGPGHVFAATGLDRYSDGTAVLKYEKVDDNAQIDPVLTLRGGEIDALLDALKEHAKPVDATVDALRDTREVRDKLLALVDRAVK